jgi:6-phosphogluconolactonase/glucosamine-6-phosphate isomerase/deaminase
MQFIRSTPDVAAVALAAELKQRLQAGQLVWLISGGSNISLAVTAMAALPPELTERLAISLIDERYGPVGHKDSNWQQLTDAGFDFQRATAQPILNGGDIETSAANYSGWLQTQLDNGVSLIGQFGMGADGHIAGILPDSPAVTANGLVTAYHSEQFDRITTTFALIRRCTAAYLLAFGDDKRPMLERLREPDSLSKQPAQILRELADSYVYNDQIGEEL